MNKFLLGLVSLHGVIFLTVPAADDFSIGRAGRGRRASISSLPDPFRRKFIDSYIAFKPDGEQKPNPADALKFVQEYICSEENGKVIFQTLETVGAWKLVLMANVYGDLEQEQKDELEKFMGDKSTEYKL